MVEWKVYKLSEVTSILGDGIHGTPQYDDGGSIYFINGNNLENGHIVIKDNTKRVSYEESLKHQKPLSERTILVSINGTIGNVAKYNGEPCILGKSACYFNVNEDVDLDFIYYVVANNNFKDTITRLATGTTIKNVSLKTMREYSFMMPPIETQKRVSSILKSLDDKIEVNRRINEQLEELAGALFKSWFVDFEPFKDGEFVESELGMIPKGWKVGKAEEFYKITIGKTPPRKEQEWFTKSSEDVKWVSISDMGNCGTYIAHSSEYLTNEAIQRFNIGVVSENTILLSFKLTIGRVAIAMCDLTTNEAIARFSLNDETLREYTYLMLKQYNYANLGSTSSIATAVNSKIIKQMRLLMPKDEVILEFSKIINPLFENIKKNQQEIHHLTTLRDTLLPKLMSGEIDVNEVKI